jgi:molecular chaperone HscB
MPPAFLMQQMEWREALDEARSTAELEALAEQVAAARQESLRTCGQLLDQQQDYPQAVQRVRALMFIERFAGDVEARLDQMDSSQQGQ